MPLLASPCSHLAGPACPGDTSPALRVGVVGAGMSGLTIAWILQAIGHQVWHLKRESVIKLKQKLS